MTSEGSLNIIDIVQKSLRSFWAVPIASVFAAGLLLILCVQLDQMGVSSFLSQQGWPFAIPGEMVMETVITLCGVIAALLTLFFSITLIILTIASSNLGVRLIDRWIANRTIRTTLSILMALLTYALLLLGLIDPDGPDEEIPRLATAVLILGISVTIPWLAYAFHHLSRRIHVDTSIVEIGTDLRKDLSNLADFDTVEYDSDDHPSRSMTASRSGYVERLDVSTLLTACKSHDARIKLDCVEGHFVLEGDVIAHVWPESVGDEAIEALSKGMLVGGFRTDRQGPRFRTMLLAEIAARAMSPAVNDYYTAYACIDHLGAAFLEPLENAAADGWVVDEDGQARLALQRRMTQSLLDDPLRVMRNAVAPFPAVSIYLGAMLVRLHGRCAHQVDANYLADRLSELVRAALLNEMISEDETRLRGLLSDVGRASDIR